MFRLKSNDIKFLLSLLEYRALTIPQITALFFSSKHVARRRISQLIEEGFLETVARGFGRKRGRPEQIISLSKKGIEFLIKKKLLPVSCKVESSNHIKFIDHQVLVNWFQIHLLHMERLIPSIKVRFLTSASLFNYREKHGFPFIPKKGFPSQGKNSNITYFIPDGVFSISITPNSNTQKPRSLLFFLEVDMGTESLSSLKRSSGDIRQKILNYQDHFRTGQYKFWESILNCEFSGFRLLFLANTYSRMIILCCLIQEMPPSDFIWVSLQNRMFKQGLSDKIWQRGGKLDNEPESIIGPKMACMSPLSPIKD